MAALAAGSGASRFSAPFAISLAGMSALAAQSSAAAAGSDYRALVCLYMSGGNDSHNWVVPIDSTGYAEYANARKGLAWPTSKLVPISTVTSQGSGRAFAMPTDLNPLRGWYESGAAAVVANVGTLVQPTTKQQYAAGTNLPPKLFSHSDQSSAWMTMAPEGAVSSWCGRMGDILMSQNGQPTFTAISANGSAAWLAGNTLVPYQVDSSGPIAIKALAATSLFGSAAAPALLRKIVATPGTTAFDGEYAAVVQRSIDCQAALQSALNAVTLPALPTTPVATSNNVNITLASEPIAQQLRIVAQLVGAGQALGMRRQVFLVSLGSFDSHANQMRDQPAMMTRVACATDYFLSALRGLGLLDAVTLFTASDFGRTLTTNGSGSDHGWGSHHVVAGGAVKGRDIYGSFPNTALGTSSDVGSGRLLPGIAVTQYAATLGGWMGVSPTDLATVLPGIANFGTGSLGFL